LAETITDGLIREVREETGLTVEPVALSGVHKSMARGIVALVFRCRIVDGTAHPTEEAAEIAWLYREEVAERMNETFAVRQHAADNADAPHVRAHDGKRLTA